MTVVWHGSVRRSHRSGSAAVEYITALVLVGISCIIGFKAFGTKVKCKMAVASAKLDGSDPPAECADTQVASNDGTPSGDSCPGGSCMIPGQHCFVAGTLVWTESGPEPIEQVRRGDRVLSRNEQTGRVALAPVTALFVTPDMPLVAVSVVRSDGSADVVRSTPGHLYWTADRAWTRADALAPDEPLLDADGDELRVGAVQAVEARAEVYNFEVEGTHSYFVGTLGAWVHNAFVKGDRIEWTDEDGEVYEGTVNSVDGNKISVTVTKEFGDAPYGGPYPSTVYPNQKPHKAGDAGETKPISTGKATITHYAPPGLNGRGSEYSRPGGKIDITSHGIGSGVYGVTPGFAAANPPNDPTSVPHPIEMQNPYHLQDQQHANSYSETSKRLQDLGNAMKNDPGIKDTPNPTPDAIQTSMNNHDGDVQNVLNSMGKTLNATDPGRDSSGDRQTVANTMQNYFRDYNDTTPGHSTAQPINHLIGGQLGHDGVFATPDSNFDRWSKGSVSFNVPPGWDKKQQTGCP